MPLFIKTPVNDEEVKQLVKKHWNVELGEKLKDSQNQTFEGTITVVNDTSKVAVRVTPNPKGSRSDAIELELSVLQFLASKSLSVCDAYPSLETGALQVPLGELSVSVFHFAKGDFVAFTELHWMLKEDMAVGLGRWLGKLHILLDEYEDTHPELASKARKWDELHDGILKEFAVDERDLKTEKEPSTAKPRPYGLIHGDINTSNYFWISEVNEPCMFDWDQFQRAWRLYDLTGSIWGVVTLQGAGSPLTMQPVPEADEEKYTNWIVRGYEEQTSTKVDRDALTRLLQIRRHLYATFCTRALDELEPGTFMHTFCKFMSDWLTSEEKQKAN